MTRHVAQALDVLAPPLGMHDYARMPDAPEPPTELARTLRGAREARKPLTQQAVAIALGVPFTYVSRWERGEVRPDVANLSRLATYYGLDLHDLIRQRNEAASGRKKAAATSPSEAPSAALPGRDPFGPFSEPEDQRRDLPRTGAAGR